MRKLLLLLTTLTFSSLAAAPSYIELRGGDLHADSYGVNVDYSAAMLSPLLAALHRHGEQGINNGGTPGSDEAIVPITLSMPHKTVVLCASLLEQVYIHFRMLPVPPNYVALEHRKARRKAVVVALRRELPRQHSNDELITMLYFASYLEVDEIVGAIATRPGLLNWNTATRLEKLPQRVRKGVANTYFNARPRADLTTANIRIHKHVLSFTMLIASLVLWRKTASTLKLLGRYTSHELYILSKLLVNHLLEHRLADPLTTTDLYILGKMVVSDWLGLKGPSLDERFGKQFIVACAYLAAALPLLGSQWAWVKFINPRIPEHITLPHPDAGLRMHKDTLRVSVYGLNLVSSILSCLCFGLVGAIIGEWVTGDTKALSYRELDAAFLKGTVVGSSIIIAGGFGSYLIFDKLVSLFEEIHPRMPRYITLLERSNKNAIVREQCLELARQGKLKKLLAAYALTKPVAQRDANAPAPQKLDALATDFSGDAQQALGVLSFPKAVAGFFTNFLPFGGDDEENDA